MKITRETNERDGNDTGKRPRNGYRKSQKALPAKERADDPTPKKRKKVSLRNVHDVKRLLAATINELRRHEENPLVAGKIMYGLTIMLTVFEQFDLAKELKELRERIEGGGYGE